MSEETGQMNFGVGVDVGLKGVSITDRFNKEEAL